MQCSNDRERSPTSKLHIRAHGAHLDASLAMGGGQMKRSPKKALQFNVILTVDFFFNESNGEQSSISVKFLQMPNDGMESAQKKEKKDSHFN